MKPICLLFVLPLLGTGCRTEQSAYLEKALSQLERIERVAYRRSSESYLPGDTIPRRYLRYYVEQRNRADTTLRHSYLSYYNADDTTRIDGGYDGTIAVDLDHDRREVVIDDFSIPRAPYRLTDMTFFCRRRPSCATCSPPLIRSAPSSPPAATDTACAWTSIETA